MLIVNNFKMDRRISFFSFNIAKIEIEKIMNKIRYIKTAIDLSLLIDKKQEIENETNISVMTARSNFFICSKFFLT
tara:strand:+ start:331 stop:558 length:228 start_codon:yes stop_codon:yes gene_type:complete